MPATARNEMAKPSPANAFAPDDVVMFDGESEPRIRDLALARRLGFGRARDIRRVIERCRETLANLGEVRAQMAKPSRKGGRATEVFWLTEKQALFVIARSDTPTAAAVTAEMVEVFHLARRGQSLERPQLARPAGVKLSPTRVAAAKMRFASAVLELDMMGIDYTTFDPKIVLGFARMLGGATRA